MGLGAEGVHSEGALGGSCACSHGNGECLSSRRNAKSEHKSREPCFGESRTDELSAVCCGAETMGGESRHHGYYFLQGGTTQTPSHPLRKTRRLVSPISFFVNYPYCIRAMWPRCKTCLDNAWNSVRAHPGL